MKMSITKIEKEVLKLRQYHTLKEVGNKIGLTRERIRQIESKAITKLLSLIEKEGELNVVSKPESNKYKYPIWVKMGHLYINNVKSKREADGKAKLWLKNRKPIPRIGEYNEPELMIKF